MENMNADKISQSIRACRKRQGLSQDELANRLHVTRQAVSKWENGSALPSVDILIALANVFQLSVDELLGVSPSRRANPRFARRPSVRCWMSKPAGRTSAPPT